MEQSVEVLLYGSKFRKLYEKQISEAFGDYHLKKIDVEILYFLHCSGNNNTSKDIVHLNMFTKGHISQSVDRMEKQNLIKFVQDGNDRRCTHLVLTEKADEIIERIVLLRQKLNKVLFEGLTEPELEEFSLISKKIEKNINDALCMAEYE